MACPSTCENPPETTGARGVCDNVTGLCICPPGFDGKDIWREFNDCHINQELRRNFLLATFVINIIAVVLSVLILSRLCYHYFRSFGCNETEQPFDDRVAVEVLQQKATLKVRRAQKRRIIFLILLQLTGCCFALPYSVSGLFVSPPVFRYEQRFLFDACMALFHISVFSSYWMSTYVWFKLLPSLPFLAKLYRMKSFVFDRPGVVPKVALVNAGCIVVVEFLVTFLLPSIYFDDPQAREDFDTVGIVAKMAFCASLCLPVVLYIRAIAKLLGQSVYQMKELEAVELKFIGKGKKSLRFIRASLMLLALIWIGVFIPALATEYGTRNRFAFYSPAACAVLAGVISSNINVGIRMAETVDLASSARPPQEDEKLQGRNVSSKMNRLAIQELLMDDEELAGDS